MRTLLYPLALCAWILTCFALQQDLAGKVDWHKALVGVPRLYPRTVAPQAIHDRVYLTSGESDGNVFAAIGPDGEILWRRLFRQPEDQVLSFYPDGDDILLLQGFSGSTVTMLNGNGTVRWVAHNHDRLDGEPYMGAHAVYAGEYVVVLSAGRRVTKYARATGEVIWSWEFPPGGHSNMFTSVAVDEQKGKVIAMGFTTQFTASAIYLVLDFESVFPITDIVVVPSHTKLDSTMLVRRKDGLGYALVWSEFGRVRVSFVGLDGKENQIVDAIPDDVDRYKRIIDVGTCEEGYVVAELEGGGAALLEINEEATIVAYFENSHATKKGAPVYAGRIGVDPKHKATFSRLAYSFASKAWEQSALAITDDGVKTTVTTSALGNNTVVRHITITSSDGVPNLVYTTSTYDVGLHCFKCSGPAALKWTRHEDLARIAAVHFVDLGKPETEEALEVMEEETFIGRLGRHVKEIKDLPAFVMSALSSSPILTVDTDVPVEVELASLPKIIVAVTTSGQAFGISPESGRIMWRSMLGFFSQDGPDLRVVHAFVTRNNTVAGNPQLAVIAERERAMSVSTVGYHVDARTGAVAGEKHPEFDVPAGKVLFPGTVKTAFLTPFVHCCTKNRVVAVVNEQDELHLFPTCKKVAKAVEALSPPLFYSVIEEDIEGPSLSGYAVSKRDGLTFATTQLWTRDFHAQQVLANTPLTPSITASYGRALGDKRVLYKYLNPHLQVVTTTSPNKALGHVYVIDSVTGTTVYEVEIPHIVGNNLRAIMVENWLVYAWLEAVPDSTEGWRLASVELYDNSAESAGASTLTTTPNINPISQVFVLSSSVAHLAFTTSKFGVTTKDVVYVNELGQIAYLPRAMLGPRRPVGKPSKADQEEMLIPYSPLLPHTPSAIVSHKYPLIGINRLTTAPTLLESTVLLLGSGRDLFCSSAIQPSGNFDILGSGFNKIQLLLTLAALSVGVFVAKPAVTRKALKEKWF